MGFCRHIVAVARHSGAPVAQVARDFRISEPCLHLRPRLDDVKDGRRIGVTQVTLGVEKESWLDPASIVRRRRDDVFAEVLAYVNEYLEADGASGGE